jgi:hypothetical protein
LVSLFIHYHAIQGTVTSQVSISFSFIYDIILTYGRNPRTLTKTPRNWRATHPRTPPQTLARAPKSPGLEPNSNTPQDAPSDPNPRPRTFEQYQALLGREVTALQTRFPNQPLARLALESFEKSIAARAALVAGLEFPAPQDGTPAQEGHEVAWDYHGDIPTAPRDKIVNFYDGMVLDANMRRPMEEGSLAMARFWGIVAEQNLAKGMPNRMDAVLFGKVRRLAGTRDTLKSARHWSGMGTIMTEKADALNVHPDITVAIGAVTDVLSVEDHTVPAWHVNHCSSTDYLRRETTAPVLDPKYYRVGALFVASAIPFKRGV